MALDSTHPLYDKYKNDWVLMRDTYGGEGVIKSKSIEYLPYTGAQLLDGINNTRALGYKNYCSYLARAVFHDYVSDAVESYIGLLHQKPAVFELPEGMQELLEKATISGEGLQNLLRRINEQQLVVGRVGLLGDLPETPDPGNPLPYIATYYAENIRNWDDSSDGIDRNKLNMVILDETNKERGADFSWNEVTKYRVLLMSKQQPTTSDTTQTTEEVVSIAPTSYMTAVFRGRDTFDPSALFMPLFRGTALNEIPFVIINSKDVVAQPDNPPLIGLARLALAIYRGEAGYRESLFMQSQDTLVTIGGRIQGPGNSPEDAIRVGAGASLQMDIGGDAKYVGVGSAGLSEQRLSLENDKKRAETKSGQMMAPTGQVESDATLTTRMAAQTATLNQIAWSGAKGLEYILKVFARWMGLKEGEVKVTPNLDFSNFMLDGKSFDDIMNAKTKGLPVSLKSLHQVAVERGLSQMTYEQELAFIAEEKALIAKENAAIGLDPTGKPIPPAPTPAPASK